MKLVRLLWAALAVAVFVWAWTWWASEERRLFGRLDALGETIAKDGPESDLAAAATGRALGDFFARGFRVEVPSAGVTIEDDRARLAQVAFAYRRQRDRIGVDFRDRELTLDERLGTALLVTTAVATAGGEGGFERESYRLETQWLKEDGVWRLSRLTVLEIVGR